MLNKRKDGRMVVTYIAGGEICEYPIIPRNRNEFKKLLCLILMRGW